MNILVVGEGKGSWEVRGEQLGTALGARVSHALRPVDLHWAERVILVKRVRPMWARVIHQHGKAFVWDALDFWRQPDDNSLSEPDARDLLQRTLAALQPDLMIGATQAMADAGHGVYLPHHAWADLTPTPAREQVKVVAYQGNPVYLGAWVRPLEVACGQRGWRFVINPPDLTAADLIVAFRDGIWDGWMCRTWKSGVKVVNAMVAGRPLITQSSAAVQELRPAGTIIEHPSELGAAFDLWTALSARAAVVAQAQVHAQTYGVAAVATRYQDILTQHLMKEATP
jgi:hypothetical protein